MSRSRIFSCIQCGNCCKKPFGRKVVVASAEAKVIADHLDVSVPKFLEKFTTKSTTDTHDTGNYLNWGETDEHCTFLTSQGKCSIHAVRPAQCRSYPFTARSMMSDHDWAAESQRCPGIQHGVAGYPSLHAELVTTANSHTLETVSEHSALTLMLGHTLRTLGDCDEMDAEMLHETAAGIELEMLRDLHYETIENNRRDVKYEGDELVVIDYYLEDKPHSRSLFFKSSPAVCQSSVQLDDGGHPIHNVGGNAALLLPHHRMLVSGLRDFAPSSSSPSPSSSTSTSSVSSTSTSIPTLTPTTTSTPQATCLIIGCGGGSLPMALAKTTHQKVTTMEIKPDVVQVASDFFGLDSDCVEVLIGDALALVSEPILSLTSPMASPLATSPTTSTEFPSTSPSTSTSTSPSSTSLSTSLRTYDTVIVDVDSDTGPDIAPSLLFIDDRALTSLSKITKGALAFNITGSTEWRRLVVHKLVEQFGDGFAEIAADHCIAWVFPQQGFREMMLAQINAEHVVDDVPTTQTPTQSTAATSITPSCDSNYVYLTSLRYWAP
eukprot:m.86951 g.86951  ORF g.86951 m.86951 type:complete len:549 (-) comp26023_c0_seq1:66-1712(-)